MHPLLVVFLALLIIHAAPAAAQLPASTPDVPVSALLRLPATAAVSRGVEIDTALEAGAWDQAARLLATEIERVPRSPQLLVLLAQVFMADRKPLNAAIAIRKAEALGPIDARTRFMLALAYVAMGRGEWAQPELDALIASDRSNPSYLYWLGRIEYDAGKYAAALERFEDVIALDPGFMRAYDNMGLCHEAQHQLDRAAARYRDAIRINKGAAHKSPWPPLNLALLLRQQGELQEAEALARESLSYDVAFAPGHFTLGVVLEDQGRVEEAAESLARAVAADPTYPDPHYALARLQRRAGRVTDADASLAEFQRLRAAKEPHRP